MDIPNLAQPTITPSKKLISLPIILIISVLAITSGFWLSRFLPTTSSSTTDSNNSLYSNTSSTENISEPDQLKAGVVYGNNDPNCKDTATGTLEKGDINGEGTHILNRPGGKDQRASLTSSVVDLDLFIDKNITITGQTNASKKTGWLLEVCSVKISEQ
jgi:hypothetical protein